MASSTKPSTQIGGGLGLAKFHLRTTNALQRLSSMDALLRSHHELRAAVRLAGQKIVKLNFGRRTDPVLEFLRRAIVSLQIAYRHLAICNKSE